VHRRTAIRLALMQTLVGANLVVGERVFTNRSRQFWPEELPCIVIYTMKEQTELISAPKLYKRRARIAIEIVDKGGTNSAQIETDASDDDAVDDRLDALCEAIEIAVTRDDTLNGTCEDIDLVETEMNFTAEGDAVIGAARMVWEAVWHEYLPPDLSEELSNLNSIHAAWDIAPTDGQIDAADDITLEQ